MAAGDSGRVVLNTYNELIGTQRMEVTRIDPQRCPWKVPGWNTTYRYSPLVDGRGTMTPHDQVCYPALDESTVDYKRFGPWHDPQRFNARMEFGEYRYYVDLVREAEFARLQVQDLSNANFVDPLRTRTVRLKLLLYNNGLPMLCSMSIEAELSVTGVMRTRVNTYSFAVQEYLPHSYIYVITLEVIFICWTLFQVRSGRARAQVAPRWTSFSLCPHVRARARIPLCSLSTRAPSSASARQGDPRARWLHHGGRLQTGRALVRASPITHLPVPCPLLTIPHYDVLVAGTSPTYSTSSTGPALR